MSGELAPGQKMSLRSVAETLGVSIMPVREAVARLVVRPVPGGAAQSRRARAADDPRRASANSRPSGWRSRALPPRRRPATARPPTSSPCSSFEEAFLARRAARPAGGPSRAGQQGAAFRRLPGDRPADPGGHHRGSLAEDRAGAELRPQGLARAASHRRRGRSTTAGSWRPSRPATGPPRARRLIGRHRGRSQFHREHRTPAGLGDPMLSHHEPQLPGQ